VFVTSFVSQVQQLAHRPHLSPRALYNCVIFLNQIKLNQATKTHDNSTIEEAGAGKKSASTDNSLPASLINTYFRLFEIAVQPPALPKGKKKKKRDAKKGPSDKIDVGMKSRLLSALLTGVNRAHPFLPRNNPLMEKHIDALYKIVHTAPPGGCTQALMLLFNLAVGSGGDSKSSEKPKSDSKAGSINEVSTGRKDRFYRALYSTLMTPTMLYSGKKHLTMYFNLIYKAMKYDTEPARIVAFGKRLLTSVMHCEASVIAGTLFLLSEVGKLQPVLANGLLKSRSGDEHTESDTPIWDPVKREPKRAFSSMGADKTNGVHEDKTVDLTGCIWEASTLSQHYHPTVQTFSSNIGTISYNGDPLRDFTLVPFLNKFAYRNSKSMKRVEEQVQHGKVAGVRRSALGGKIEALSAPPVNDPKHWKNTQQSDADAFFLTFFKERARRDEINGVVRGKGAATSDDLLDATEKAEMADVSKIVIRFSDTF
jgi:ribosome biogenesis protein MAK21